MIKKAVFTLILFLLVLPGCHRSAKDKRKLAVELYVNAMVSRSGKLDDQAIADLKNSVKVDPEFTLAHSMMGQIYKDSGQYELAATSYEKACALNRWSFTNHFSLGEVYFTLEKFEDAKNKFGRAVLIKPEHVQANFNLGACYYETDDFANALKYYSRAADLDPQNDLILSLMGDMQGLLENPEAALASYRKSLDINPDQPKIMINMAKIYLSTGRYDPANLLLKKAIELDNKDPYPHFCLGYIALQKDQPEKAWENYQEALNLDGDNFQALNGAAVSNIFMHYKDPKNLSKIKAAVNYWQRSLAINPDQNDIKDKLAKYQKILDDAPVE
ncbi:MAG: tetratricopeptide repeat protein [Phycisphaerae bacterium]|nr:tetratricopeptide repeat protein [Phycisphaerae bacterium]